MIFKDNYKESQIQKKNYLFCSLFFVTRFLFSPYL
ncbi:hypothetical protein M2408_003068 [Sphingobacterium sp. BIGb0165]|nr:hypothetical protein [Sphingobacterium sp. BIGb0165]